MPSTPAPIVVVKTGDTDDLTDDAFSALNAAVAAQIGRTLYMHGGSIYTNGQGAHGFKLHQANSSAYLYDISIAATSDFAPGVYIAGGYVYVQGATVTTNGEYCDAFSTDKGAGVVEVVGGKAFTLGEHSNLIYSTGYITVTNLQGVRHSGYY